MSTMKWSSSLCLLLHLMLVSIHSISSAIPDAQIDSPSSFTTMNSSSSTPEPSPTDFSSSSENNLQQQTAYSKEVSSIATVHQSTLFSSLQPTPLFNNNISQPAVPPPPRCPRNTDDVIEYNWPPTNRSSVVFKLCPSPLRGLVHRWCDRNTKWDKPRFRNCQATSLEDLYNALHSILNNGNEDREDALYFITQLKNLTSAQRDEALASMNAFSNMSFLSGNDLRTVNLACSKTLDVFNETEPDEGIPEVFSLISNALDQRNKHAWKELQEEEAGSEELLNSAEKYVKLAARNLKQNGDSLRFSEANIALRLKRTAVDKLKDQIFPDRDDLANTMVSSTDMSRIRIPADYIRTMTTGMDEAALTAFILFPTLQDFLPNQEPENVTVGSVILSAQIVSDDGGSLSSSTVMAVNNLTSIINGSYPIEMNFTMNVPLSKDHSATCVYWNFSHSFMENSTSSGGWLSDGIVTELIDNSTVRCLSNHLTSFAVLVDVSGTQYSLIPAVIPEFGDIPKIYSKTLAGVMYIGSCLSIICLIATSIYIISLGKEIFDKVHYFIHLNLSISLGLGLIVLVTGMELAAPYPTVCRVVAGLMHYLFLSAFCWMLCEAITIFLMVVVVFTTLHKKWYMFLVIGWVPSLLLVSVTFGVFYDDYIEEPTTICWLNDSNDIIWAFTGPVCLIILINFVILVIVFVQMYRSKRRIRRMSVLGTQQPNTASSGRVGSKQDQCRYNRTCQAMSMIRGVIVLLPLLGITWVGGFFALNENTLILACVFSVFNSLQGVFIFLFHVVFSQRVIAWFKRFIKKHKAARTSSSPNLSLVGRACKHTDDSSISV